MHEHKGWGEKKERKKKGGGKTVRSGHYCAKSSSIVLHSIPFYSKNIVKTPTKPSQAKRVC